MPFLVPALPLTAGPPTQPGPGEAEEGGRELGKRFEAEDEFDSFPAFSEDPPSPGCTGQWGASVVGGGSRRWATRHSHSDGGLAHLLRQNKKRSRAEQSQLGSKSSHSEAKAPKELSNRGGHFIG